MARCLRCHRVLKDVEAQKIGYGKICYEKLFGKPFPIPKKQSRLTFCFKQQEEIYEEENPPLFDDKYFK